MIETNLLHEDLINNEPMLESHLHKSQVDYQQAIKTAYRLMIQDIKNQNLFIRKLCKKLWLQETSATATAAVYTSATSKEDFVERNRWVINVSALSSGPAIFHLQGRNKATETFTTINTQQVVEPGVHKFLVTDALPNTELEIYRYYRIYKSDTSSTVTFKSYLIEMTYENLHLWKTLSLIFETLAVKGEDIFRSKAEKYAEMYNYYLVNNKYYYDANDDGEINEVEQEADYRKIRLIRG